MHEAAILCGGLTSGLPLGKQRIIELDVSPVAPMSRRIDFNAQKIAARLVDDMPAVVADAVELAVYAFVADRMVKRGSAGDPGIGSEWRRNLRFRVPVRRPEVWSRPEVLQALVEALTFLSDDRFEFEFVQSKKPVLIERSLGFRDPQAQVIQPDLIALFSGGLDSLAGIASEVHAAGRTAVLVTHQSSNNIAARQNALATTLAERIGPKRLFYAPVRVGRGKDEPKEHSQRLRSFLFATLGFAYARMFDRDRFHIFENGVTSFNLPIAGHVVGTRASRTTHPRTLMLFSRLFSLLIDRPFGTEAPYIWKSKADIVRILADAGWRDLIRETTSCASVRNFAFTGHQCGVCSQCVERRFAVLAHVPDADIAADYGTDLFRDGQGDARTLAMIEGHVMRAHRLAGMDQHSFLANYGQAFRALAMDGESPTAVAGRLFALHQRYGREFLSVLDKQLARYSSFENQLGLAPTSLLGMVGSRSRVEPFRDAAEREPPTISSKPPPHAAVDVIFAVDDERRRIMFRGGPELAGVGYTLVARLARHRREVLEVGGPEMITSAILQAELDVSDNALRRRVERVRKAFQHAMEPIWGFLPDTHDLIQSAAWQGYRLNPRVVIVDLSQVHAPATELSRVGRRNVTARRHAA